MSSAVPHRPSPGLYAVRVVVLTIIVTIFCFAVALFFGIVGVFLVDIARGGALNMTVAYRHVAFPIAIGALVVAFCATLITELRHYRRSKAQYNEWTRAA